MYKLQNYMILLLLFVSVKKLFTQIYDDEKHSNIKRKDGVYFITGGEVAPLGKIPHQVFIQRLRTLICGGALISDMHVLSAAHCFQKTDSMLKYPNSFSVVAGDVDSYAVGTQRQTRFITYVYIPKLNDQLRFSNWIDIALVKTSAPFTYSNFIKPIELAEFYPEVDTLCTVSGWGVTESIISKGVYSSNRYLRFVVIYILESKNCSDTVDNYNETFLVCAGGFGKDACLGDSGGPLECGGKLVGIVSTGKGCGLRKNGGAYTRVYSHMNWIRSTLLCNNSECENTKTIEFKTSNAADDRLKNFKKILILIFTLLSLP